MQTETIAYCFVTGHIGFGDKLPEGAIMVAKGHDETLREFISGIARHSYDGVTLLVPGVPEAECENMALHAFEGWLHWISLKPPAGVRPAFTDWNSKAVRQ